jgi:hypothetical protein
MCSKCSVEESTGWVRQTVVALSTTEVEYMEVKKHYGCKGFVQESGLSRNL